MVSEIQRDSDEDEAETEEVHEVLRELSYVELCWAMNMFQSIWNILNIIMIDIIDILFFWYN